MEDRMGICPVCRKVFQAKDIEHVLDLVGAYSQLNLEDTESIKNDTILHSDSENTRRQKFEATLKLQQENNGLIEPKKTEVLLPGMFLPRPTTTTTTTTTTDTATATTTTGEQAAKSGVPANKPSGSHGKRYRGKNSRNQVNRQWVVKDNGNTQ